MLDILDAIHSIVARAIGRGYVPLSRWVADPTPLPAPRDFTAMIDDEVEEARRRADACAAEPLLPSTDYRTNPRPSQVATVPRCYY